VSVGQQLVDPVKSCMRNPTPTCDPTCVPGGDEPGSLAFSPRLAEALNFVDGALASTFQPLDARGLSRSTEVIISAKHGQSPIDPAKLHKIGDAVAALQANQVGSDSARIQTILSGGCDRAARFLARST
jgi:hypothetical protein